MGDGVTTAYQVRVCAVAHNKEIVKLFQKETSTLTKTFKILQWYYMKSHGVIWYHMILYDDV